MCSGEVHLLERRTYNVGLQELVAASGKLRLSSTQCDGLWYSNANDQLGGSYPVFEQIGGAELGPPKSSRVIGVRVCRGCGYVGIKSMRRNLFLADGSEKRISGLACVPPHDLVACMGEGVGPIGNLSARCQRYHGRCFPRERPTPPLKTRGRRHCVLNPGGV